MNILRKIKNPETSSWEDVYSIPVTDLNSKVDKINLLSVTIPVNPLGLQVGQKYYDSTNKKIHSVYLIPGTGVNSWDAGIVPSNGVIYLFNGTNYVWNDLDLIEISSGNGTSIDLTGYQQKLETLFNINYWDSSEPETPSVNNYWYNSSNKILSIYVSGESNFWSPVDLSSNFVYMYDGNTYIWTGTDMLQISQSTTPSNPEIYIGSIQPANTFKLWIDTENNFIYALEDDEWTVIGSSSKGISSITKTNTAGLVDTYTITYTDTTTSTFTVTNGAKGDKGDTGSQGAKGEQGIQGETGSQGVQGIKGDTGSQGIQGVKGDIGNTGVQGEQGIQGVKGNKGDKGDTGTQGLQGVQGVAGTNGTNGENGTNGTSSVLNLSLFKQGSNGVVFPQMFKWTSDKTISAVELLTNCADISVTIGATTYNHTTLVGVTLTSGTVLVINDITVQTGYTNANVIIIF